MESDHRKLLEEILAAIKHLDATTTGLHLALSVREVRLKS